MDTTDVLTDIGDDREQLLDRTGSNKEMVTGEYRRSKWYAKAHDYLLVLMGAILMTVTAGNAKQENTSTRRSFKLKGQDGQVAAPLIIGSLAACVAACIVSLYVVRPPSSIGYVKIMLFLIIMSGIIVMVCISIGYKRGHLKPPEASRPGTGSIQIYFVLAVAWLIVFGLMTTVFNFLKVMTMIECVQNNDHHTNPAYAWCYELMQFCFVVGQMIFLCSLGNTQFAHGPVIHYGLKCIVLADFSIWLIEVIKNNIDSHGSVNGTTDNGTLYSDCQQNSTSIKRLESARPFLHPFVTEFCLLAAGLVMEMGHFEDSELPVDLSNGQKTEQTPLLEELREISTSIPLDGSRKRSSSAVNIPNMECSGGLFIISLLIPILVTMGLLLLPVYVPDEKDPQYLKLVTVYWWYFILYDALYLILICIGFHKLRTECCPAEKQNEITPNQYILIICNFSLVFYAFIRLIAAIYLTNDPSYGAIAGLLAAESMVNTIGVWLQTTFLIIAQNFERHRTSASSWGIQYLCTFLVVLNFGYWCIDSFTFVQFPVVTPVERKYYKSEAWTLLENVCLPLAIFYRFHSFLSFLKLSIKFSSPNDGNEPYKYK